MTRHRLVLFALFALVLSMLSPTAVGATTGELAATNGGLTVDSSFEKAAVSINGQKLVSVLVKFTDPALASYEGGIDGLAPTSPRVTGKRLDLTSPEARRYLAHLKTRQDAFERGLERALPGSVVTQRFSTVFGGVAALVPLEELDKVRGMSGVAGVFLDTMEKPLTDASPAFIGATDAWNTLGGQSEAGEGVVVGVIDTGIWPEHPSFSDPDPFGNPYPAPPASFTGTACEFGNTEFNPNDAPFTCNNKLVAAYDFTLTYQAVQGLLPTEFASARDSNGHGTHTASTAAGNGGVQATLLGVDRGMVSGIAPRAHVAAYKACGAEGCFGSDLIAAIQQATIDGVDVINYSISGGGSPYTDGASLAFLDAAAAGVVVTPSAGNSGPGAGTVAHREPWTLTVGASTSNRHFISTITLTGENGETTELMVEGASVTEGIDTPTPVIFPPEGEELCLEPFPEGTFNGEIVVCRRGQIARVAKSFNVAAGGAGGMILYNPTLQGLATDNHFIPSVHVENDAGAAIVDFMNTHTNVMGTFTDGVATTVQGDVMAAFSSRGGPNQTLGISKPDVTAPGVQILAGHTPMPEDQNGGLPGQLFQSIQGTSMSAPHAAGAAALLVDAHPDWSPAEVKSALMLTAKTAGVTKEDKTTPADPFDMGSGRIQPGVAINSPLTMDIAPIDYLIHQDDLWNVNYPSIYLPMMPGHMNVTRTFTSQLDKWSRWSVSVDSPPELVINTDRFFYIRPGGHTSLDIDIDASRMNEGDTAFATITLSHEGHTLHLPVTVVRGQPGVTMTHGCDPLMFQQGSGSVCHIEIENTTFEAHDISLRTLIPKELRLRDVEGARKIGGGLIRLDDTLAGAEPPSPSLDVVGTDTTPAGGYLPLAGFGPLELSASDESISNLSGFGEFVFGGETYDRIGVVSNGYAVAGGGDSGDVDFINSPLPDPARPNNTIAPFWTDLDPSKGGRLLAQILSDGTNAWLVLEWESVPLWSDGTATNTFQIWIGLNGVEDITYVYGPDLTLGDGGFLTVGVENDTGTRGDMEYFDGTGTPPAADVAYRVNSIPGAPGGKALIEYTVVGFKAGPFRTVAELTSDAFQGTSTAVVYGEVTPRFRR